MAGLYSISQNKLVQSLQGGSGAITHVLWWNNRPVIATASGTVKIFDGSSEVASFSSHAGGVTALALHPCGEILASVGEDKSYVFYDLSNLRPITQIYTDSGKRECMWARCHVRPTDNITGLTTAGFHPDGHLFAAGSVGGQIKVFDVKSGFNAANFDCPSSIKAFSFSENGTWLAVVTEGQTSVAIWDLRKAAEIKQLEIGTPVDSVRWDYTGQFLAAGGPSGIAVQSYSKSTKLWTESFRAAVPAVAVEWGQRAQSLVSVQKDGSLTVLGAS